MSLITIEERARDESILVLFFMFYCRDLIDSKPRMVMLVRRFVANRSCEN